jgi:hypothetical protein
LAVIPTNWTPVHRADGEHVGYLAPDGAPRRVHPLLLTGSALGPAGSAPDARELLVARGLAALDRRWWCRLPAALPAGVLAAGSPQPDWSWQPVVLVEVSPTGVTVRPEFVGPGVTGRASLPVPVGGLMLPEPPE